MQISDEQVELAARKVATAHYAKRFDKPEDDPHVQMNVDANWHIFADDARIALSALSLPVQPVAWTNATQLMFEYGRPGTFWPARRDRDGAIDPADIPLYATPPVPPTNGPEDDLIAAREAAAQAYEADGIDGIAQWIRDGENDTFAVKAALLSLRSRPASALPEVEIDRFNGIIEHIENRCLAADGPVTPTMSEISDSELAEVWQLLQNIRSALIPSVQP